MDKHACIDRAKKLIATGGVENLRYAALELRLCMETITYQKLRASAPDIPSSVIDTWQPPQAVKALLEYDPNADKDFVIYMGIESEVGKESKDMKYVGEHKTPKLAWLKKHYNKVGSYLHASPKDETPDAKKLAAYLSEVTADLEEVAAGTILGGWMDVVHQFECAVCKQLTMVGKMRLDKSGHFVCMKPGCGAEYFGALDAQGNVSIKLKVTEFDCHACAAEIPIENRKLAVGIVFECGSCKAIHRIMTRQWGYALESGTIPNEGVSG